MATYKALLLLANLNKQSQPPAQHSKDPDNIMQSKTVGIVRRKQRHVDGKAGRDVQQPPP